MECLTPEQIMSLPGPSSVCHRRAMGTQLRLFLLVNSSVCLPLLLVNLYDLNEKTSLIAFTKGQQLALWMESPPTPFPRLSTLQFLSLTGPPLPILPLCSGVHSNTHLGTQQIVPRITCVPCIMLIWEPQSEQGGVPSPIPATDPYTGLTEQWSLSSMSCSDKKGQGSRDRSLVALLQGCLGSLGLTLIT